MMVYEMMSEISLATNRSKLGQKQKSSIHRPVCVRGWRVDIGMVDISWRKTCCLLDTSSTIP